MIKKIFLGILAILIGLGAFIIYEKTQVVGEKVNPLTYFDEFIGNENNLVFEDQRIGYKEPVREIEGEIYISYEVANEYISDTIFYDSNEKILTLTSATQVIRLREGINEVNFMGKNGSYSIKELDGIVYLSSNLVGDFFEVQLTKGEDNGLYIATDYRLDRLVATIKHKSSLRTHPRDKSTVVEILSKGEEVTVYDETEGFLRVKSANGIIGYIPESDVKHRTEINAEVSEAEEQWPGNPLGETVKLVWDQHNSADYVDWSAVKYQNVTQANVISPTWFQFSDANGSLSDGGNSAYVDIAHSKGLQVWPLLSHNFSEPALTKQILVSTEKRQNVINQIIAKAKLYGFDGINIDIENIQQETSAVWVQFMRELYPQLKAEGIIVSVDVYMPSDWSGHYEREKVSKACDYFIVMAYDQHWSGSEEAGSVAELPWVEMGIQKNLEEVPKEKLVLGIPFYTRLWKRTSEGLSSSSYDMLSAMELVNSWGATPIMDEASGQPYVSYQEGTTTYELWIENKETIGKRIELMKKYNLAGYGAWKLSLESANVWEVLGQVE